MPCETEEGEGVAWVEEPIRHDDYAGNAAHLLAATPTCHYLEDVEWADAALEEPLRVQDGFAQVPARPGLGLAWRAEAVRSLALG